MKYGIRILGLLIGIYVLVCLAMFANQESLIFLPEKLPADFKFQHRGNFTELDIPVDDDSHINGLLFKTANPRGLIFYLHGNAGSLKNWGNVAETYNLMGYDVFIMDYRGFGKSGGNIGSEQQFFSDVQIAYNHMKAQYQEKDIVVIGYSIGTGPAAKLAADNNPRLLVLQAPFYSLLDMMDRRYPLVPKFLLKYRFETDKHLQQCNMPVVIFHGTQDEIIPFESAVRLKAFLKPNDSLIPLEGEGHRGITENPVYLDEMRRLLGRS